MTREEAERELVAAGIGWDDGGPRLALFQDLITEHLARREAEERVKFLDAALDAAIIDRDYYNSKLEQAEARVKELEEEVEIAWGTPPKFEAGSQMRDAIRKLKEEKQP